MRIGGLVGTKGDRRHEPSEAQRVCLNCVGSQTVEFATGNSVIDLHKLPAGRLSQFSKATQRIGQLHLSRSPTLGLEQMRTRNQDGSASGT